MQIVHSSHRGSRDIEHLGSAHTAAEVELLKAAARQKLAAHHGELCLEHARHDTSIRALEDDQSILETERFLPDEQMVLSDATRAIRIGRVGKHVTRRRFPGELHKTRDAARSFGVRQGGAKGEN